MAVTLEEEAKLYLMLWMLQYGQTPVNGMDASDNLDVKIQYLFTWNVSGDVTCYCADHGYLVKSEDYNLWHVTDSGAEFASS